MRHYARNIVRGSMAILSVVIACSLYHYSAHSAPESALESTLLDAAEHGDTEIVNALIKTGVDVNTQDEEGFTALTYAAERGYIDDVIEPKFTRQKLIRGLQILDSKTDNNPPKKHGNIPL